MQYSTDYTIDAAQLCACYLNRKVFQKTSPKFLQPKKRKSEKNVVVVNEESTLVLEKPDITANVYINLERLSIITFNIKTIRI